MTLDISPAVEKTLLQNPLVKSYFFVCTATHAIEAHLDFDVAQKNMIRMCDEWKQPLWFVRYGRAVNGRVIFI